MQHKRRYYPLLPHQRSSIAAPVSPGHCCAGGQVGTAGGTPRRASNGEQLCEECCRRLSRCKGKLYKKDPGHICQACYNKASRPSFAAADSTASAAAVAPPRSHKRRAVSDPGESPEPAAPPALTRRVTSPPPLPASKKQRMTRQEERIMRQLDETHARRMAAEAAAAATAATAAPAAVAAAAAPAAAGEQGTTHTGFTVVFVP